MASFPALRTATTVFSHLAKKKTKNKRAGKPEAPSPSHQLRFSQKNEQSSFTCPQIDPKAIREGTYTARQKVPTGREKIPGEQFPMTGGETLLQRVTGKTNEFVKKTEFRLFSSEEGRREKML